MRALRVTALLGLAVPGCFAAGLTKAQLNDCPVAFKPYSTAGTPLLDLMLDPAAKEVVDRNIPGFLKGFPPELIKPEPPSLADILTIRIIGEEFAPLPAAALDKMDKELAALPVTPEIAEKRCARYDYVKPDVPNKLSHPALLIFSKINGFRDNPSVDAAQAALKAICENRGWSTFFTENGAVFNAKDLKKFDAVVWNNVSGDVLTKSQRIAFQSYIEHGGGYAGVHGSAGDPYYEWDWYPDTLIGARFWGHPMSPQFQEARIRVDKDDNSIVKGVAAEWRMTDEWYSFRSDPRSKGAHVLLTLDETTYQPMAMKRSIKMGDDHPIAWANCIGKGRVFYSAIGHRPEGYTEPNTNKLIEQGVAWAARVDKGICGT